MYLNHSWSLQTVWTTVGIDCPNSNPTKICNLHSSEAIAAIVGLLKKCDLEILPDILHHKHRYNHNKWKMQYTRCYDIFSHHLSLVCEGLNSPPGICVVPTDLKSLPSRCICCYKHTKSQSIKWKAARKEDTCYIFGIAILWIEARPLNQSY